MVLCGFGMVWLLYCLVKLYLNVGELCFVGDDVWYIYVNICMMCVCSN